ncbi:50S ribosomal protein L2 [Candidatus Woesebacteria bacterium RIFCSPHIGHO2_01_FULL_39_17]|uniref:Large ribosomal subunit protein uL2 n=4 Tax=Microgenomates group TaxID=1794810 RepID=A0A0H4TAL7_9BACT|nr:50S ribosomal protein L2 [uncultured Microgenomates bacterium Rifle_16ft_4_minimus_954]KKQ51957.1 MAG: 50S ribosomal protein L2, large subunit ribosomal protein L2 [Microgenomates group bacterium GW2011_GWC1_38_12]KKQ94379.1 MAG: ribosomal protein L2, bacterial/organellar [Candidatus Woesebacteria bacterium GW2011_GWB1_39_10b]KKR14391.1 MAG: ribosomal protein L2, bacterial/organellar [Candidatus Woesebacteria bacterium GW2011_GWA1_39_21b]OGM23809.1 MAG: 50S ribosomal protein L2 [Candidatus W
MRQLLTLLPKKSGRDVKGHVSVRHQGGRAKRFLREIDFKRDKKEVLGVVELIEYDPNRNASIAKIIYEDGERRFILAPLGLRQGSKIIASFTAPLEPGNALPLTKIPAGTQVHNIEISPGKGGQIVKTAGGSAVVQGKDENWVIVKLPSGETRRFRPECWATLGQIGNVELKTRRLGKAGRKRRMGIRPSVRGVAMHPGAHPHGGGEGRSGVGLKYPKTPWGKPAVGKTRKRKKYSNSLIISPRKKGPHVG